MATIISVREGPLAVFGETDGKTYLLLGENTLEAKRQALLAKQYAEGAGGDVSAGVEQAQAWAEGTAPGGAGTKSAREYAAGLEASASQIRKADGSIAAVTIGRPSITDTSNSAALAGTYVFANPLDRTSTYNTLRVRNPTGVARTIHLGRFTFDGTNFQQVPGTSYLAVAIATGPVNLEIPIALFGKRGEYLGFSVPGAGSVGPAYNAALPGDSGGYFFAAGVDRPTGAFVPGAKQTGIQLQIGIDGSYALAYDDLKPQLDATGSTATLAQDTSSKARGALAIVTTGRPSITDTSTNGCVAGTYVFANSVRRSGTRHTMRVRKSLAGAITLYLGRFTFDGTNFQQVAGTGYVPVTIPGGGNATVSISMYAARGEYLGFSIPGAGSVGITYNAALPGDSGGYYVAAGVDRPTGAFAAGAKQTGIQLQIGFDADYALAYDDLTADIQPQIDAHTAGLSTAQALASNASGKVAAITTSETADGLTRVASSYSNFPTGTPNTLSWAVGFMGSDLPADAVVNGFVATVHRAAGVTTFEARLYSRAATKVTAPDANDTAEWAAWVSVSAAGVTEGSFGDVAVNAPANLTVDAAKGYYYLIRAKDASGTIVAMGYANVGNGSAFNQLQRGFYRNSGDTAWSAVGTTGLLALRVRIAVTKIAASALPSTTAATSSAPRKKRATLVMMGRTEQVFDNTAAGGTSFRRIFAVPANAKRVVGVIFAHATTSAQEITRAAVAPLASAANFAASGSAWTPLTFGTGGEKGTMPAAAAAKRWGWLASRDPSVTLLDRTDVPGAAKLVAVSAYMGASGSPVLLGYSNRDDYRTNWEARSDFPMVMRHNAGDCVTTPANFTSTANDLDTTPIAGLVIEADDGELMTVAAGGDSITNGAGITVSGFVRYGQGWVEKIAYSLNSKRRGVVPVMLGWSGLNMQGIRDNAVGFYSFAKANGLPVPNILFAPNASPNSMPVPNTLESMNAQRVLSDSIIGTALGAGSQVITWTVLPVDPSVKDFNASDSVRRDYNDADRAAAGLQTGAVLAEYANAVSGGLDADGQELFHDDFEDDGIHPNAAGHAVLAAVGTRAARAVMPAAGYAVGGLVT